MAQHTDNISHGTPPGNTDTPLDISRYTVPEAAQALGISPEAVRNRLSRGTLKSVKEKGTVYVLLGDDMVQSTADIPHDTSRHAADTPRDISGGFSELISAKDEAIQVLREQLEAEREANRENRRIIAGLVQRVPELEAASEIVSEPRESPETASQGVEGEEVPFEEQQRSWWRRFFGL